jgi:hypothetical protein
MEPSPQLWWSLYQEAKQWQAGIAALVGFLGLIVAALWNFHLNRRRDARIRAQETRTVASALYGEILLLRNELAALAEFVAQTNQMSEADKSFYTPSSLILYPALAEKVGLLPANLLLGMTKFCSCRRCASWIRNLLSTTERNIQVFGAYCFRGRP